MSNTNRSHPTPPRIDADGLTRAQRLDLMLDLLMLAREELGFNKHEQPLTLAEIAAFLGLSRERVRQIEAEVIGKLRRASARRKQLQTV